jgi:hypothetical protein
VAPSWKRDTPRNRSRPAGQRCASRFDRVGGIGLAGAASGLAVGAIDLDHLDPGGAQVAGQAGAVGARALHPDAGDRSERGQPTKELVVAGRGCLERLDAQQPADVVERGGDVHVEVGVDAARHRARPFYDGHRHPFSR